MGVAFKDCLMMEVSFFEGVLLLAILAVPVVFVLMFLMAVSQPSRIPKMSGGQDLSASRPSASATPEYTSVPAEWVVIVPPKGNA